MGVSTRRGKGERGTGEGDGGRAFSSAPGTALALVKHWLAGSDSGLARWNEHDSGCQNTTARTDLFPHTFTLAIAQLRAIDYFVFLPVQQRDSPQGSLSASYHLQYGTLAMAMARKRAAGA
jgi:hypothetical protein